MMPFASVLTAALTGDMLPLISRRNTRSSAIRHKGHDGSGGNGDGGGTAGMGGGGDVGEGGE